MPPGAAAPQLRRWPGGRAQTQMMAEMYVVERSWRRWTRRSTASHRNERRFAGRHRDRRLARRSHGRTTRRRTHAKQATGHTASVERPAGGWIECQRRRARSPNSPLLVLLLHTHSRAVDLFHERPAPPSGRAEAARHSESARTQTTTRQSRAINPSTPSAAHLPRFVSKNRRQCHIHHQLHTFQSLLRTANCTTSDSKRARRHSRAAPRVACTPPTHKSNRPVRGVDELLVRLRVALAGRILF
jgi:hypothetical protein